MTRVARLALAVAVLLAGASHARAITLDECLVLARQHAPSIQISDAGVSRAEQAIHEARAALAPTLRVAGSALRRSEAQ